MKPPLLILGLVLLGLAPFSAIAASDTDVTLLKVTSVTIEQDKVTIVARAITSLIALTGDHDPAYKGFAQWGQPAARIQIKSDSATFIIKRPEGPPSAWDMTLDAARDFKEGREVGRIGFYRPKIVIHENTIQSIEGFGYLYPKGK